MLIAFNNLLKNAVQYSDNRNPVVIRLTICEGNKLVEFTNSGQAFTEDEQEQLFTPFYRGSNTNGIKGHGLGLSLVRQIAEINHATIEYERKNLENIFRLRF
jgi:signal transduction histidine kinase